MKLNLDDRPSLPVHEGCGGTILSSQYWTVPAASREKLNCTADIFVDKKALEGLPNLLGEFEDQLADRVTYAWMLLEHLLGGQEAVRRSFTYTTSGTCPIDRKKLVKIVVDLCDGILEHMGRSSSVEGTEEVRVEVLSLMKPLTDVGYRDLEGYKQAKFRFPSDLFLREYLKESSYPDEGKVQVTRGFDFYVDEEKLRLMVAGYREKADKLKVV
ncbi:hypothetical protein RvY_02737 [Ramazzottius varieornatus]|uniref:Uncharacterized protein n=1 Tax=Ramazzottius varieornatus TaxID=947166 RepID=A0A1D1URI7_RAMVA|nr:hypothetical protein RvY_02737 [Ramazzottius varieornatus]